MGGDFSRSISRKRKNSSSSSDEEMVIDYDCDIPSDLLIDVLSYVPLEDLIKSCRLVCKYWKSIIDGHCLWKLKCERENKVLPPTPILMSLPSVKLKKLPHNFYRDIYLYNPYGRNLLCNGSGENLMSDWVVVLNGGDGFAVENPPKGSDPVPAEVGFTSCFATSYAPCQKMQMIDLLACGIHPEIIDLPTTKIEIGEWYAARFDCESTYAIKVLLMDDRRSLRYGSDELSECIVDEFEFQYREQQWVGKEWHKVCHIFENLAGTRRVYFHHTGRDHQYWAGQYGSKMTGAYVKVIL